MLSGSCWSRYAQGKSCLSWAVSLIKPISVCRSSWKNCHQACCLLRIVWLIWGSNAGWLYWLPNIHCRHHFQQTESMLVIIHHVALCNLPRSFPIHTWTLCAEWWYLASMLDADATSCAQLHSMWMYLETLWLTMQAFWPPPALLVCMSICATDALLVCMSI